MMADMSLKNKVIKVYPMAICFNEKSSDPFDPWEFCIMKGPLEQIRYGHWPKQYSLWCASEINAWKDAWNRVKEDMINKLEE